MGRGCGSACWPGHPGPGLGLADLRPSRCHCHPPKSTGVEVWDSGRVECYCRTWRRALLHCCCYSTTKLRERQHQYTVTTMSHTHTHTPTTPRQVNKLWSEHTTVGSCNRDTLDHFAFTLKDGWAERTNGFKCFAIVCVLPVPGERVVILGGRAGPAVAIVFVAFSSFLPQWCRNVAWGFVFSWKELVKGCAGLGGDGHRPPVRDILRVVSHLEDRVCLGVTATTWREIHNRSEDRSHAYSPKHFWTTAHTLKLWWNTHKNITRNWAQVTCKSYYKLTCQNAIYKPQTCTTS